MQPDAVMITQAVDEEDPVLGFTPGWVNALSDNLRSLAVFCLRAGRHSLRDNVSLRVIGDGRIGRLWRLRKGLKADLKGMDIGAIFAHMCPRYAVAARRIVGPNVPIILWYAHSAKSFWLRWAHRTAHIVLTPTIESCPIRSEKVKAVGHGINTEKFSPVTRKQGSETVLLSAGRITPVKKYDFLIEAFGEAVRLVPAGKLVLRILGSPCVPDDEQYLSRLKGLIRDRGLQGVVEFRAAVPYNRIEKEYASCDVFVNTALRHSIDKAPLEAMACGRVLLTSNRNFRPLLGEHAELLVADDEDPRDLARKIVHVARMRLSEREKLGLVLREIVVRNHDLRGLMKKVVETIAESGVG
ncbi:glycosyltransferase family 4 protein [bacterium]|nr:glycosyltransferase family 4 protein [bacterium]